MAETRGFVGFPGYPTTTDVGRVFAAVLENPSGWLTYSVLADALEDAGRHEEAAGARWLGRRKKRPYTPTLPEEEQGWCKWFCPAKKLRFAPDAASDLPKTVFDLLEGGTVTHSVNYRVRTFGTVADAVWAAARAAGAALASGKLKGVRR
jgi:hypothetical protein